MVFVYLLLLLYLCYRDNKLLIFGVESGLLKDRIWFNNVLKL